MKEMKIGEEIRIRCVEDRESENYSCEGCYFDTICNCATDPYCYKESRKDGKNVHYELVED